MLFRLLPAVWDQRKLGCLPSPGRTDCLTQCPGSVGPSGASEVQAAAVRLGRLGLATLKLSWM